MRLKWIPGALAAVALSTAAATPASAHIAVEMGEDAVAGSADFGGPFALVDHHGRPVTEHHLLGKVSILYFGYTNCPDICPIDTQSIAAALDLLDGAPVQAFFVTVDPERDTPERLADWLSAIDPRIIGLTGTAAEIEAVTRAYKVRFRRMEGGSDEDYMVSHPGLIYLMGTDGAFQALLPSGATPEEIAVEVRSAMEAAKP